MDIAKRITEFRKKKGWSKYELAKISGIAPNSVYAWDKGTMPSLTNIQILCEALDITLCQFFSGDGCYFPTEEEKFLLEEWIALSEVEKTSIRDLIETFKILKLR